jgi:hypothetical protein
MPSLNPDLVVAAAQRPGVDRRHLDEVGVRTAGERACRGHHRCSSPWSSQHADLGTREAAISLECPLDGLDVTVDPLVVPTVAIAVVP